MQSGTSGTAAGISRRGQEGKPTYKKPEGGQTLLNNQSSLVSFAGGILDPHSSIKSPSPGAYCLGPTVREQ